MYPGLNDKLWIILLKTLKKYSGVLYEMSRARHTILEIW
jgi:hypothetical protein